MTLSILIGQNIDDINNIKRLKNIIDNISDDNDLKDWLNNIYSTLTDPSQYTANNIQIPAVV